MKTVREKLLENRIARLEKLICSKHKRKVCEEAPREGRMIVRDILAQYAGTDGVDDAELYEELTNTDVLSLMIDDLGLDPDEYLEDAKSMQDILDSSCRVRNLGLNQWGNYDVEVQVPGLGSFTLDWVADEDSYDESCNRRTRNIRRR